MKNISNDNKFDIFKAIGDQIYLLNNDSLYSCDKFGNIWTKDKSFYSQNMKFNDKKKKKNIILLTTNNGLWTKSISNITNRGFTKNITIPYSQDGNPGNNIDLIKTFVLKTLIIESECIIKFLKLILEGPKYLVPLSDEIIALSFVILASAPEKLLQVAFSLIIFSTIDFGKQV